MSNTYKHKGKGYWNNGIEDKNKPEIRKYLNHCHRHNSERGLFKPLELKLKEEIADVEMERALAEITYENSGLHLQNVSNNVVSVCESCRHFPRNLMNKTCAECDDGDNWEAN